MAGLPIKLFLVREVLVLAASAGGEVLAMRLDPIRGGLDDFDQIGVGAVVFISPNFGADFFAREDERDEDDPAVRFCNACSEVGESYDLEIYDLVPFIRFRFEFAGAFLSHEVKVGGLRSLGDLNLGKLRGRDVDRAVSLDLWSRGEERGGLGDGFFLSLGEELIGGVWV